MTTTMDETQLPLSDEETEQRKSDLARLGSNPYLLKAGSPLGFLTALLEGVELVMYNRLGGDDLVLDTSYYGHIIKDTPCGCVATAAAQHLIGITLNAYSIQSRISRAEDFEVTLREQALYEEFTEDIRMGQYAAFCDLYMAYGLPVPRILTPEACAKFLIDRDLDLIDEDNTAELQGQLDDAWKLVHALTNAN